MFKECAMRLADGILAKKEDLLRKAITHNIGSDGWTLEEIKGRCHFLVDGDNKETFCMDEKPMIEFYPVASKCEGNILTASQAYRILYT